MSRLRTSVLVIALFAIVAACTHRVTRPSTAQQTAERMEGWPRSIEGVVLRSGRTVDLPQSADVRVQGDSLILKRVLHDDGRIWMDSIRIADVSHVIIQEYHVGRTLLAAVLVPIAIAGAIAIIEEATKDPDPPPQTSCPIIYAFNGHAFVAVAEPLGGAISEGLARTDLSELEDLALVDGEYHVLIANEMREIQYLDAFSLIAADHPEGTSVIADRAGNLHVAAPFVAPVRAVSASGRDILPALRAHDHQWWSPGTSAAPFADGHARDTITLTFPRPAHPDARLVLHARTSELGAHALKVMLELWGGEVDHWYGLLDGSPAARAAHQEWVQREELWTMRVWVRETGGWVHRNVAYGGGPYLSELQAIEVDLSNAAAGETVELRLHPPRGYWDIDFAALDTTHASTPNVTELQIADADSLDGQDTSALLRAADGAHLVMPERGVRLNVTFAAEPPAPGMTRTLFSRSTGHYRIETDRSGMRQAARLDSLWLQPGYAVKLAERFHGDRQYAAGNQQ